MLAKRIIPSVLIRGQQIVKGRRFDSWRTVGHAQQAARIYAARQCDELILLDIAATPEGRGPDLEMVRAWTEKNFAPITVGGGVRSVDDVRALLAAGADKVACCTSIAKVPRLLVEASDIFGRQALVAAIDYTYVADPEWKAPRPAVTVQCGKTALGNTLDDSIMPMHPVEWAQRCELAGAGEILLTCIDREGAMEGYDLDLIREVANAVNIPVIAHGGCGTYGHMGQAIDAGASAVAAGAIFQFTEQTPRGAAEYLQSCGIEVRTT